MLLDYLGEPAKVTLHPWPLITTPLTALNREDALEQSRVMVVDHQPGLPVPVRPGDAAMEGGSVSGVFNRLNWETFAPGEDEALMDANASPTILWSPARLQAEAILPSSLGSQADSMAQISKDYERWVNRSMSWMRRNGTRVWELEGGARRGQIWTSTSASSAPSLHSQAPCRRWNLAHPAGTLNHDVPVKGRPKRWSSLQADSISRAAICVRQRMPGRSSLL